MQSQQSSRRGSRVEQMIQGIPGVPVKVAKVGQTVQKPAGTSWLQTTCLAALSSMVEIFARFYTTVAPLLPDLLSLINNCIDQSGDELGQIGVKCWVMLVKTAGEHQPNTIRTPSQHCFNTMPTPV
jgi:hypothetical protein